jgi:hypothetical protein
MRSVRVAPDLACVLMIVRPSAPASVIPEDFRHPLKGDTLFKTKRKQGRTVYTL